MKKRILGLTFAALATGLVYGNASIQAASGYHLIVIHSSDNTGEGTVTVDRARLHPVPLMGEVESEGDCSTGVCGATYPWGTRVILTATAAPGSTFTGWSGECEGTSPTCVVRMGPGHREVMVHFSR